MKNWQLLKTASFLNDTDIRTIIEAAKENHAGKYKTEGSSF